MQQKQSCQPLLSVQGNKMNVVITFITQKRPIHKV